MFKFTPEQIKYRGLKTSAANKGRVMSEEQKRNHSKMMTGRKYSAEIVERRVAPMRGRPQTKKLTKKGPTNKRAITAWFRSPFNLVYKAKCIAHFVRTHEDLFLPEDVEWIKPDKGGHCKAYKGLLSMTCHHKDTRTTWKGWTRVSHTEVVLAQGRDLLNRQVR